LHPHVDRLLPLEAAEQGLDLLRNRKAVGKIVVDVADHSAAMRS
jgi:NADPH2:quinone reductase